MAAGTLAVIRLWERSRLQAVALPGAWSALCRRYGLPANEDTALAVVDVEEQFMLVQHAVREEDAELRRRRKAEGH